MTDKIFRAMCIRCKNYFWNTSTEAGVCDTCKDLIKEQNIQNDFFNTFGHLIPTAEKNRLEQELSKYGS